MRSVRIFCPLASGVNERLLNGFLAIVLMACGLAVSLHGTHS